jgi:hypothetical protein
MLLYIFTLLFCGILALITYHDFKYRALPIYSLVVALVLGILVSFCKNGWSFTLYYAGVNTILVCLQLGVTTLYFSARGRKLVNIFSSHLGIGDFIFFIVITFSFSPLNFIIFFVLSGLVILVFYTPFKKRVLIPYAGWLSVFLFLILILSFIFKGIQPYNDYFLLDINWN